MVFSKRIVFPIMLAMVIGFSCDALESNRTYIGVVFDPSPFISDVRGMQKQAPKNAEEQLVAPLSKIWSKFNKILYKCRHDEIAFEGTPAAYVVPLSVATYNKFQRYAKDTPLELSLNLILDLFGETSETRKWAVHRTIRAVDHANQIFAETVKRIFIEHIDFNQHTAEREVEDFGSILSSVNFSESIFKYELGASLAMHYCAAPGLSKVLQLVRHISFIWWPNVKSGLEGFPQPNPKSAMARLSEEYEECLQIIRGFHGSNISVGIQTGWISSFNNTNGSDKDLVEFWELVNEWAIRENAFVMLTKAFDSLGDTQEKLWEHSGWWKIVENPSGKNASSKYEFMEKKDALLETIKQLPSFGKRLAIILIFVAASTVLTAVSVIGYKYIKCGIKPMYLQR